MEETQTDSLTSIKSYESDIRFDSDINVYSLRLNAEDKRDRRKIQKRAIRKIIKFYIGVHYICLLTIIGFYLLERLAFTPISYVITDKVMLAFVGALAVQSAGIIVAAFSGLFKE